MFACRFFYRDRIYVSGGWRHLVGQEPGLAEVHQPPRTGDITANALVWTYPLKQHVMATPAIHDNIVYIADCGRTFQRH